VIAGILKVGAWGGLGFLIGVLAVWWIEPNTGAGTSVILAICIVAFVVVGALISNLFGKKEPSDKTKAPESAKPSEPDGENDY
jgi:hypothetical protein